MPALCNKPVALPIEAYDDSLTANDLRLTGLDLARTESLLPANEEQVDFFGVRTSMAQLRL